MNRTNAILAAAAGALFLSASPALAEEGMGTDTTTVKCEGVNSCKGHSDCSTAEHECAGKNGCKGKGFRMMTPEECQAAKEKLEKKD